MEGGWSRKTVSYCFCAALPYAHAHCPCERCNGKAVSRYTEYKHWKDSKALASARQRIIGVSESADNVTFITTTTVIAATPSHVTTASSIASVTLSTTCTSTSITSATVDQMFTSTASVDQSSISGFVHIRNLNE